MNNSKAGRQPQKANIETDMPMKTFFKLCSLLAPVWWLAAFDTHAADIVWTNTAGGNFNVAANWSPNQVPGADDRAFITNNGTYAVTFNASATVAGLTVGGDSGSIFFNQTSGTLTLSGPGMLNSNSVYTLSGGTLTGAGDLTAGGAFNWTGGTMSGAGVTTIASGATLTLDGGNRTLTARTLVNAGQATWNAGTVSMTSGAVLSNAPGATFEAAFDGSLGAVGGSEAIHNAGLWRKTGGEGTASLRESFFNSGTVEVQSGRLSLQSGGMNSGTINLASGTTLDFAGGVHQLETDSVVTGPGDVVFNSGTVHVLGEFTPSGSNTISGATVNFDAPTGVALTELTVSSGTLSGTNEVTVTDALTWTGGTMSGAGVTTIASGATLTLDGGNRTLSGRMLVNAGQAAWNAGTVSMTSGAVLSNAPGATFEAAFDGSLGAVGGSEAIYNAGLWRKTEGDGTASLRESFFNSGTVEVQSGTLAFSGVYQQTGGLTLLNGGDINNSQPLQIQGGTLAGNGIVSGNVTSSGVVAPGTSSGSLNIAGHYTQTADGALNIELAGGAPGTEFDRLVVGGTANLAGTVNTFLTDDFYPAANAAFTFLTAGTRAGTFDTFNFPADDVGMEITYAADTATIEVINARPVLPLLANQTVDELTLLSANAAATDDDVPAQTLTYVLLSPPDGATVDANGLITWTPSEEQGPMTAQITVRVTDNGTPNLSVARAFQVAVREINTPPELTLPPPQVVDEESLFSLTVSATDSDIPGNDLTFELVSGPTGLSVAPDGAITWTPTVAQGPDNYLVTVRVTDDNPDAANETQLSATNSFSITVNEVNLPPVLTVPANQALDELIAWNAAAMATDPDLPPNVLTFALVSAPEGLSLDPVTGAISWTPGETQGPGEHIIEVQVSDNGIPSLSVTQSFTVTVSEVNEPPALHLPPDQMLHATTPLALTATAIDADWPANVLTFSLLSGPEGLNVGNDGAITWNPADAQIGTNTVQVRVADDGIPSLSDTQSFSVTVVARPLLFAPLIDGTNVTLTWTAIPGVNYRVLHASSLAQPQWSNLSDDVTALNETATATDTVTVGDRYYRVHVVP